MIDDFSTTTEDPREGRELVIVCMVTGTPKPTVVWSKDNVTLSAEEDNLFISVSPHDQVRINSASPTDSGVYSCRATNLAGSVESMMRIEVKGMFNTPQLD